MVSALTLGGKRKMTGSQEMGAQQDGCSRLACEGKGPLVGGQNQSEGTTRRGIDNPVHHPEKPTGSTLSSTSGLSLREHRGTSP